MNEEIYHIKQVADMLGLSTDQLRRIDVTGKIKAKRKLHGQRNYRYYTDEDVAEIKKLFMIRNQLGVNLKTSMLLKKKIPEKQDQLHSKESLTQWLNSGAKKLSRLALMPLIPPTTLNH